MSIRTKSIKDSIIKHQGLFSHGGSWRNRPIGIGLADVREPSSPQFRLEPIAQCIKSPGNGSALFLPDVICYSEVDTNLWQNWYNKHNTQKEITQIISIMRIITITFSAFSAVLKPKVQKMSSIRWNRFLLINGISFTKVPFAECLQRKRQAVKDMPTMDESNTYKSTSALSNSSKVFSEVGWKMGMSKYFTK